MLTLVLACAILSAEPEPLVVFDTAACFEPFGDDSVLKYDALKLAASLQGLANRERPRLVLRFMPALDDYWLDLMRRDWLKDRPLRRANSLEELIGLFPDCARGVVLWDPALAATSNVAATVCGVEGWLPVRAGSALYGRLVKEGPKLPVKMSLVGKFDSKCGAYLWAKEEYLDTGKCNDALMAYYIDAYTQKPGEPGYAYHDLANATLANQDYYIARRAFFFDLGPWHDEAPVDDPGQEPGTDRKTLIALLRSLYAQNKGGKIATVGGFVPWNLKYTNFGAAGGKHEPVPTEWEYAAILSAHNAIMDADALGLSCLTNASAYAHYPLRDHYEQNPRPVPRPLEPKTYVLVYTGDYDSAAWLARHIPSVWDDPARGKIPMAWAFNPNLADRVPHVFDHIYRTRTENDWFIGGDSGAGYLNPNLLVGERLGSGLPDALDLWVEHNKSYYERFDYTITGFVINGFHGDMPLRLQKAYAQFSPDGVGMQLGFEQPLVDGTPFLRHVSDIYPKLDNLQKTAAQMAFFAKQDKPQFLIYRMILQKPSTVLAIRDLLQQSRNQHNWEFCDPYTFFDLYKKFLERS